VLGGVLACCLSILRACWAATSRGFSAASELTRRWRDRDAAATRQCGGFWGNGSSGATSRGCWAARRSRVGAGQRASSLGGGSVAMGRDALQERSARGVMIPDGNGYPLPAYPVGFYPLG
jgi:hypothetical protein